MTGDERPWCGLQCEGKCAAEIEAQPPVWMCRQGGRYWSSAMTVKGKRVRK